MNAKVFADIAVSRSRALVAYQSVADAVIRADPDPI